MEILKKLLFLLLLMPIAVLGQRINSTESSGLNNIYNDALSRYLKELDKSGIKYDTLYLRKDPVVITDNLLPKINDTVIKIVDLGEGELSGILDHKESIIFHWLFPLSFEKGVFSIGLSPFITKKEHGEIQMKKPGGSRVVYSFDQQNKQFQFIKYESWGI